MMSREHMRGTVCGVLLMATPLLLPLRALAQEEIGKTVSKEGDKEQSPEFRKEPTKDFQPVPLEQPVEEKEQLQTKEKDPSKLGVLLDSGSTVTMSEATKVEVIDKDNKKVRLRLGSGTMRVLEVHDGSGAVTITETTDNRGTGDPKNTEYIVSCGPSDIITDPDLCLFVAVHGRIDVTGAGVTVTLTQNQYTYVRQNQPPTAPQPLPNLAFLQLLVDETTIAGTGKSGDRLIIVGKLPDPLTLPTPLLPPGNVGPEQRRQIEEKVPGYPIREFEFPTPPNPPSFP